MIEEPTSARPPSFVSRGGLKLRHALDTFSFDPRALRCADFGANVGGFTDCLLQAGAAQVIALDTGYGTLAWTLRKDPRVKVLERTNALHAAPPTALDDRVDLVVIDMGWTPQRLCIPVALKWLRPTGRLITLIKPHYEIDKSESSLLQHGVLSELDAERITRRTLDAMPALGARVLDSTRSPIVGGAGKGNKLGNAEWLALLIPNQLEPNQLEPNQLEPNQLEPAPLEPPPLTPAPCPPTSQPSA